MNEFDNSNFAVCGKTVRAAEINIIMPLLSIRGITRKYDISYTRSVSLMTVKRRGRVNYFKDESSYMLIQGITLCGVLLNGR